MRFVTRFITGQDDVPKQFCPMMDGLTWFENTMNRVAQLVPLERSFVVVKQSHRRFYEPQIPEISAAVRIGYMNQQRIELFSG